MSKVKLSFAFSRSARSAPLLDGVVEVAGVDLVPCVVDPGDIFWRQLHHAEFDASEFSLAALLMRRSQGDDTWGAVPVFPSRAFFHTNILVRRDAGIERPEDLRGRRVGIPEYQQTAGLWTRGALAHEFGVRPEEMEWVMGRSPRRSHGSATGFVPPDGVRMQYAPDGATLASLTLEGKLDALFAYSSRSGGLGLGQEPMEWRQPWAGGPGIVGADRLEGDLADRVNQLFPDARQEGLRYWRATGILPLNHTLLLRRSLVDRYPWLPRNLFDAFVAARQMAVRRLLVELEPYAALDGVDLDEVRAADAAFPYGISGNRATLEAACAYAHEQGLIAKPISPEDVFFETVLES